MATNTPFVLPEAVQKALSQGQPAIRAYRNYLGYSVEDVAVTTGLAVEEIEKIEKGHRYEKGYRDRIARALGLPDGMFDEMSDISDAA